MDRVHTASHLRLVEPVAPTLVGAPMRVLERSVYRGPHLYSHTPMIRFQLDLGLLEEYPTNRLPGFTERLLALLPSLEAHGCSARKPGGLVERLEEGTWLGHVIEHVALELQSLAGMPVARGKTRSVKGRPGVYNVMFEYREEDAGLCAARLALELVVSLLDAPFNRLEGASILYAYERGEAFDLDAAVKLIRRAARATKLGPTTRSVVTEAERRGIPWQRLDEYSLIQLGTGRHQRRIRASITGTTPHIAVETAGNKDLTKSLLRGAGIPVPHGSVVRTVEDAIAAAIRVGFPVTVKPLDGNHGRGVATDLGDADAVRTAFERATAHGRWVIVEEHYTGRDHRILVVDGKVVAVSERIPAHVVGNGTDTVAALVASVNTDPRRGDGHEEVMTKITIDDHVHAALARVGLTRDSVPEIGRTVLLRDTANISTGGTAVDRTDDIHPDNATIAERAARAIGLDVAGIDMILPDITRSWRDTGGGIVEVNAAPGFRMHLEPSEGRPRNVAKPVVDMLFPRGAPTRVPVVAITGTNGKSTTVRMLAHILQQNCRTVGFTSTSGIFVNGETIWKGDASGPQSARLLLRDPTIDYAVLETARGGILREGLGFSSCDVGAVLNISADHLGLKGINTLEDLAAVKSVVTESVGRRGMSVLNADDPLTLAMARHAGGRICFFSMHGMSDAIRANLDQGGCAVTREKIGGVDNIVIHDGDRRIPVVVAGDIPATLGGLADFNIENALAACACAFALGIDPKQIRSGLLTFSSSFAQNPGRLNIHDGHGFRVIMDYAHNPAALRAFLGLVGKMGVNYRRIIGSISTPGDRREEDIREMGAIAGQAFDLLVFRELPDNRGRPVGEVVRLLSEGAIQAGCPKERIVCVLPEGEAADFCLRSAEPGDLVILTPTKLEACWKQVLDFKPQRTSRDGVSPMSRPPVSAHV